VLTVVVVLNEVELLKVGSGGEMDEGKVEQIGRRLGYL